MRILGQAMGVLLALAMTGCAGKKPREVRVSTIPPPRERTVGTVSFVNEELGFVLIDTGVLYTPPPAGTKLHVKEQGNRTVVLKASEERKRPFFTADIMEGTPKTGEMVYQ